MNKKYLHTKVVLIFFTLQLLVINSALYSSNPPPDDFGKIGKKTALFLEKLPGDSVSSFWVFFRDKGLEEKEGYKKALLEGQSRFPQRTLQRRILRGKGEAVDFYDLPVHKPYVDSVNSTGVEIKTVTRWLNGVSVLGTKKDIERIAEFDFVSKIQKVITYYRSLPEIKEGEIPGYKKSLVPNLLQYGPSYAQLLQIHIPELHNLGFNGRGVRIGVLDTGYYLRHQAFQYLRDSSRIIATYDFINDDEDVDDSLVSDIQRRHGTYILSAIAGFVPDTLIGPAYNSEYVLAKTELEGQEIETEEYWWVKGIEWAESLGVDIVTSSVGYTDWYTWDDLDGNTAVTTIAADLAVFKGVVVVNSAGNERNDPWHYIVAPADGDSVISVGAVNLDGNIASFSSAGFPGDFQKGKIKPDVCALGVGTWCANMWGTYGGVDGTSLSAPLVAGACALILQIHPDWSPIQLREALWKTASQADSPDTLKGYGIVNTFRAGYSIIYPDTFKFMAIHKGNNPEAQEMSISNPGSEVLKWNASSDVNWLTLTPDSGYTPATCTLAVDIYGLDNGVYRGDVTVNLSRSDSIIITQHAGVTLVISGTNKIWVYPNPFQDSLNIFVGKSSSEKPVNLYVFTLAGELVYKHSSEIFQEVYNTSWNGKNSRGEDLAAGIYLLKVDVGKESEIVKIVKIK
ncbi:MAG: S8 family serine peptidase [candidate division Zixibacteria bacterium]|nr:S8 family serine peptidase [candidate division Zixibacteria bacterium]